MNSLLDKFMSRKGLYVSFWMAAIIGVTTLITFTARLQKEVPPLPQIVKSVSGETLYTYADIVKGKEYFQQFDLHDWGTVLGMGAYMGPDFSGELMHRRALSLYATYAVELFGKPQADLTAIELAGVKVRVIQDFKEETLLREPGMTYSTASTKAFHENVAYVVKMLVEGDPSRAFAGGVIRPDEAAKIAVFFEWSQLVASSNREGTDRTWSNDWPSEPLIDQDVSYLSHYVSLWEWLILWPLTILVIYVSYEYLLKKDEDDPLEEPLKITKLFPSQKKVLKYVPIVSLFFLLQMIIGGYLAHLYVDPTNDFIIPQEILPFNILRAMHTQLAIFWVAIGWLVGGLLIAPWIANEDHKFPWLVDVLWAALLVVGVGGLSGLYLGAQGEMREYWFWFGNEGRELINLGRVWDIGLVIGLVLWFLMIVSLIKKASTNNPIVATIIWSSFGIATLYIAGMMPVHKIIPNYTVDDYYRWWVIHLWVELTFELFAAGTLAFFTVSLGLIGRKTAEKIMFFELFLIAVSGVLGVGHHYWWQGLDEYWIAVGGLFSAIEPLPLVLMVIEAAKNAKEKIHSAEGFAFSTPFMWLAGSAVLNWIGAGWLGMVINTPTINYYGHGTYLIMPHGHVALLGAFGYISIAFIYMAARANCLAKDWEWDDTLAKYAFWLITVGVLLFAAFTLVIGFHQTEVAHDMGYYAARLHSSLDPVMGWMWARILPDAMMIVGGAIIFYDLIMKIYFGKKRA